MAFDLEIVGYRCFSEYPVKLSFQDGPIAIVGANNTGKSALLRFFYEFRHVFDPIMQFGLNQRPSVNLRQVVDPDEVFSSQGSGPIRLKCSFDSMSNRGNSKHFSLLLELTRNLAFNIELETDEGLCTGRYSAGPGAVRFDSEEYEIRPHLAEIYSTLSNTFYIGSSRGVIGATPDVFFDMSSGSKLVELWKSHRAGMTIQRERCRQVLDRLARLLDLPDLRIDAGAAGSAMIVESGRTSRRLDEVGNGISQLFCIFTNLALRERKPDYILIDEPELSLHPLLQRRLISALLAEATRGVIFATHSLGLARSTSAPVYMTRFSDKANSSELLLLNENRDIRDALAALSYCGFLDLGVAAVMLVEGPHDVNTMRAVLKHFDLHERIVIIPLNGDSSINERSVELLADLRRLGCPVFALIDSECDRPHHQPSLNRLAFITACESHGIRAHILERRALENYLSSQAIGNTLGSSAIVGHYDKPTRDLKKHGASIASQMSKGDFKNDLGEFLGNIKACLADQSG